MALFAMASYHEKVMTILISQKGDNVQERKQPQVARQLPRFKG